MDDETTPDTPPKLKLAEGLEARVIRFEMPLRSSKEAYAQAAYLRANAGKRTTEIQAMEPIVKPEKLQRIVAEQGEDIHGGATNHGERTDS